MHPYFFRVQRIVLLALPFLYLGVSNLGDSHLAGTASAAQAQPEGTNASALHAEQMARGLDLFKREVRHILVARCVKCHGGENTEGEFDLTTRAGLLQGGAEGKAVELGNSKASLLYKLITHEASPEMPEDGARLNQPSVAAIAKWIDLGAPYDKPLLAKDEDPQAWTRRKIDDAARAFWSFQPLQAVAPRQQTADNWSRTTIDRFVYDRLLAHQLQPNEIADRKTLLRRAYFDLIGLPPTPQQLARFINDKDPQAYEHEIDRLLQSPHYGERWARHWLDVARFAESHGFEQDYDRPHAYHYRDFVIQALNQDMPYDQFVRWQLAGDEIAPENPLAMMATGFLGAGVFPTQLTEKEFEPARYDELDDMVATMGTSMLGLTIGCARCHDHKFDPIPAADYYRLAATFTSTIRSEIDIDLDNVQHNAERARWQREHDKLVAAREEIVKQDSNAAELGELDARIQEHLKQKPAAKPTKVMVSSEGFPPIKHHADDRGFPHFYPETSFLHRGDTTQKHGVAESGYLQVLTTGGSDTPWRVAPPAGWRTSYRRRSLAGWITDTEEGAGRLLARVIVNRLWHHHLGRGIVATTNDFGFQGQRPTHPELLDWLASELIESGWQLKRLHKQIMTSAVYMQSAETDHGPEPPGQDSLGQDTIRAPGKNFSNRLAVDPDNQWYWRFSPRRLEAEIIRDAMLAVSGQLDRTMFGPGTLDIGMKRRSIYFTIKRSKLIPMMQIFDSPEPLVSVGDRPATTIAPQALMFMNNSHVRSYAKSLASRIMLLGGDASESHVQLAYQIALAREPSLGEREDSLRFLDAQAESHRDSKNADVARLALADLCQVLMGLNEFIYVD